MPKTAAEAEELLREWGRDHSCPDCAEDYVGTFRRSTCVARHVIREVVEAGQAWGSPEHDDIVEEAALQMLHSSEELMANMAIWEAYVTAKRLVGGHVRAYEIMRECVRGEDVAQPTVKEAVAGDREIDELMEA